MSKTPINMITLMNVAWDNKKKYAHSEFEERCKNLLSHSFVEYENIYINFCKNKGQTYDNQVFYLYQRILIAFMLSDGDFLQGEYDAYCKFCKWAKIESLSVADCRSVYSKKTFYDDLVEDMKLLVELRQYIDPENYDAMVQGFCYLCLMGDKAMDENEFYILRCFFEEGYDYAPSTWAQFKKEW